MGLRTTALVILKKAFPVDSILCLSYPDLVCTTGEIERIYGYKPQKTTDYGTWHGKDHPLPDTQEFFEFVGAKKVDYIDVHASRGCETIVDLNKRQRLGQYDLVIDPGTTEHCFNIGQAMVNAAEAVKPGGFIFHSPPVTMVNHGFWNVCPTALWDFYTQNNWRVRGIWVARKDEIEPLDNPVKRMQIVGESSLYCIAQRRGGEKMRWPTQSKYLANPDLK